MRRVLSAVALVGVLAVGAGCSSDAEPMGIDGSPLVTVSIPDEPTRPPVLVMPVLDGEFDPAQKPVAPTVDENGAVVFAGLTLGASRNTEQMFSPGAISQDGESWVLGLEVPAKAEKAWGALVKECAAKATTCPTGSAALVDSGSVLGVVDVGADGTKVVVETREAAEKIAEALAS